MADQSQPTHITDLADSISPERIGTYLTASGFDTERALKMYEWNVEIGATFHLPIQATEVALRNRISEAFVDVYGASWWKQRNFLAVLPPEGRADIDTAERRIRHMNHSVNSPRIIATLSFGFWAGALKPRFNPAVWSQGITKYFPGAEPDVTRALIDEWCATTVKLRNRIWHHEPVFNMNLSQHYSDLMKLLNAACPRKHQWVRSQCKVQKVLRQKP